MAHTCCCHCGEHSQWLNPAPPRARVSCVSFLFAPRPSTKLRPSGLRGSNYIAPPGLSDWPSDTSTPWGVPPPPPPHGVSETGRPVRPCILAFPMILAPAIATAAAAAAERTAPSHAVGQYVGGRRCFSGAAGEGGGGVACVGRARLPPV